MKERKNVSYWSFKGENTKEYTHGLHTYPAMMIPQVARELINLYGKNAKTLLDPFCGTGTSLVEASLTNNIEKAYGLDLNPLSILISRVKTTPLDTIKLEGYLKWILSKKKARKNSPKFERIEFWFKPYVVNDLSKLKSSIDKINDKKIREFFLVVFSETVRNVSNTRNKEFKLYRMSEEMLKEHNPDVLSEFKNRAEKNIKSMKSYNKYRNGAHVKAEVGSSMERIPLEKNSVDLVVTSPPYGDSGTTVAYGQFSRLASQWIGYEEAKNLDKKLLGGKTPKKIDFDVDAPLLKETIDKIKKEDEKRARQVWSFYRDFCETVKQIDRVMAKGGHICFVVGNRTVKGVTIPTDKIMEEMFKVYGNYKHIATHIREIPNKRMPSKNSPSNKKNQTGKTMSNEFIFVLQKI